ncbi:MULTISPECIES: periplasmic heavy metal sensor [Asticcacaulis]|uniref:periplasmic heavy metal sensor n=1 Tax=Asticcacaulis TaxID=76890 RepID=UPI001AE921E4|nr:MULTISPECIES: periplasmic heavy metal sensor [Asticcacaulis]MBP2157765.1 putative membrane protein [Asticcacaulis solisilvae]MDR6798810.1 putative membrane protein [Asticcacaulis sp. BE141]
MTPKTLKWLLGVSVALNLFLIAGGIGAGVVLNQHMKRPPAAANWGGHPNETMTPEAKARIKAVIKKAALEGEPDMEKARTLRKDAGKVAAAEPYDAARVIALSDQARSYEDMARGKIETALIEDMAQLSAKEREAVASFILRPSFRFRKFLEKDGAPQPNGKPAPASASAK